MWFISCPPISLYKSCLFWFCCPPRRPLNTWLFRLFSTLSIEFPGFCSSFWPLWLPILLSISFIWPCTKCRPLAFSCHSPFFEGAGLDRGLTLPLCGRHTCPGIYPGSSHAWVFAIDHPGLPDFCHPSRYLDALQFRSQCEMARKVSGDAQISSLAPHFTKRSYR